MKLIGKLRNTFLSLLFMFPLSLYADNLMDAEVPSSYFPSDTQFTTISGIDGSGTNAAGSNLIIEAGQSTGTGTGGSILLKASSVSGTSSTTINAISTVGTVSISGLSISGTVAATTVTGANVTSGANPGHTHTGSSLSSIDISDDTNLAGDTEIILTGDALSIVSTVTRDTEWDTEAEVQTAWGSVNILLETEIDASTELAGLMDDETGSGALVFGTTPTIAGANVTATVNMSGVTVFTPSSAQVVSTTAYTVLANATMIVLNPDDDYTLASAPSIADGVTGQILYITVANGETKTVVFTDEGGLASSNLELGAATRTVGDQDVLVLLFDGVKWIEVSFTAN